jgi:DNA polymerase-1
MIHYFSGQVDSFCTYNSDWSLDKVIDYLSSKDILGLDTETEGLFNHNNKMIMLQIGDNDNQFVFDVRTYNVDRLTPILENEKIVKVLQNAKFDYKFFKMEGISLNNIYDTQLAEMVLTTGLDSSVNLAAITLKYLGKELDKSVRNQFINLNGSPFTNKQIKYGALDVEDLLKIKVEQEAELTKWDLHDCLRLENKFVGVLADIEYNGFYLDRSLWVELGEANKENLNKAKKVLDIYVLENNYSKFIDYQLDMFSDGYTCNISWDSPKQVVKFLKFLGVNTVIKDSKTGKDKNTCEEKQIKKYEKEFPFLKLYFKYKAIAKEVSTYGEAFLSNINKHSGRVHSNYWQIVSTGRISSSKPNLQNIPAREEFRSCFIAEENNTLIVADYSGQEQRVLADKCLDPSLLDFYENGDGDMHCLITRKIFPEVKDLDTPSIKKDHNSKRNFAKTIGFAMNYGGSEHTIADRLNISISEAKGLVDAYFKGFPVMTEYFQKVTKETSEKGYILIDDVTKRKSFISDFDEYLENSKKVKEFGFWEKYKKDKETYSGIVKNYYTKKGSIGRNSQNYPIQGLSGSMTKLACIYLKEELIKLNLYEKIMIVNVVHDEVVVEAPVKYTEKAKLLVSKCMEKAGDVFCKTVPMKAEGVITNYWRH